MDRFHKKYVHKNVYKDKHTPKGQKGGHMLNECAHPSYHRAERQERKEFLDFYYTFFYQSFFLYNPSQNSFLSCLFALLEYACLSTHSYEHTFYEIYPSGQKGNSYEHTFM